jgi:hypothetical protein
MDGNVASTEMGKGTGMEGSSEGGNGGGRRAEMERGGWGRGG